MAQAEPAPPPAPDRWRRRIVRALIAAATGVPFWAAVPDTDLWWLGFVMWVPWLWMIDDLDPWPAFGYGLITGVSAIAVGYFWMTELLTRFAFPEIAWGAASMPLSVVVHLLFSCWQGSEWGLAAMLLVWIRRRTGIGVLWLAAPCWLAIEAFLPNLFPTYMALAWCWHPLWIQVAEIAGVTAVTFVMCSINAALFVVLHRWWCARSIDRRAAVVWLAWMIGVPAYGAVRMASVDADIEQAPKVKFAVVQGNFGIETYQRERRRILRNLQNKTAQLEREGAQIALWGETAYPRVVLRDATHDYARRGARRGFGIPLVLGVITRDSPDPDTGYPWNSAWVLNPDNSFGDRYDKVYPLLFGEAAPSFVDPEWYTELIPKASHINRGTSAGVLRVDGWRLGALICYEDILPRHVRATARQDVHAFVNLTNDSWFGNTREQPEHLGLAVFRSIEHRKPLLRSVNAGISAYVDPAGRVVEQTAVTDSDRDGYGEADGFTATVPMMDPQAHTLYGTTGEAFNGLTVLALAGLVLWRRRRSRP